MRCRFRSRSSSAKTRENVTNRNSVQISLNKAVACLSEGGVQPETTEGEDVKGLNPIESGLVAFFVDGVRLIGLPPSVGGIYGLLFASRAPLALDDFVSRLEISKGSASQGLRVLRQLGAVREVELEGSRRIYYQAETQLKRLVGGFIREEIRPHLDSGTQKSIDLHTAVEQVKDNEDRNFYKVQVGQVDQWMKKARKVLPLLQKVLGE